ncbi:hypothetical protein [Streptomyces noursei]|uniref:hypothetical protein n=1 Tax=Streptomyces noursei TaxID=1971 RepID=UPI001672A5E1|nr:hypothetical protein [Streptomyces noursei]MCZ1014006.1 hypothetical protein [Streptomyces noursei]GGX49131.1 hypothetical protein GCM10010341_83460 [Streptomyces noursei]
MSVNFYAFGPFPGGDTSGEGLHIGQHAPSSRFLFRAHPDMGLVSRAAWAEFIRRPDVHIKAEHGRDITVEEMEETWLRRHDSRGWPLKTRRSQRAYPRSGDLIDAEGYELYNGRFF